MTFTYRPVPVWGAIGSLVSFGGPAGAHATVTDPDGLPVTCTQGGTTYTGYVLTNGDGSGIDPFTSDTGPRVTLTLNGFTFQLVADEIFDDVVTHAELAAAVAAAVGGATVAGLAIIEQNGDGSWPDRTLTTTDRHQLLIYEAHDLTMLPAVASVDTVGSPLPTPLDQFIYVAP